MPRLDGIEAARQIKVFYPTTAVLILSAYDDDQFVFRLLEEAGAAGYLLKSIRGQARSKPTIIEPMVRGSTFSAG